MIVDLVRTTTPDGMRLDGVLHAATTSWPQRPVDLAICVHGVGSNFYSSSVMEQIAVPLTGLGIPTLRVNTRGHDNISTATTNAGRRWQGAAFEIVDECRLDVQGWLEWASKQGFARVLLVGHSLGAIKCLYAAAHETLPTVRGIVAISPPRLSYSKFRRGPDVEKFFEAMATAEGYFQQRRPETLFQAKFPFPLFITGSGYIDKYGPRERYNFLKFLDRVTVPILFTFGEIELQSSHSPFIGILEAIALQTSARRDVHMVTIANADHIYSGQHAALGGAVSEWLKRACSPA